MKNIVKKINEAKEYTIFVLGDSITEGFCATDDEHTYTAVFARLIAEKYPQRQVVRYDGKTFSCPQCELLPLEKYVGPISVQDGDEGRITIVRCGIGGNTVARLLARKDDFLGKAIDGRTADLFTVCLGINDSLTNDRRKYVTPDTYAANLERLLDEMRLSAPDADVIFMTPTYNDFGTSAESTVDDYAHAMVSVAEKHGIPVIDLHKKWMAHMVIGSENYGQRDWLTGKEGDYCHPSNVGHSAIAEEMILRIFE